jgi:predicted dehydrogenase
MLNLIPGKVTQVLGDFQKRVWHSVGVEDHGRVVILFENGATADYWISNIAALARPKWLILGTKGAIRADWGSDSLHVVSHTSGVPLVSTADIALPGYGSTEYYRTVADHLLMGEQLEVTPEQARRVIGVIDAAQRSWRAGSSVAPTGDWS